MKFLNEKPALLLDELEKRTLVISDLHLGMEYEIYRKGISIPPRAEKQKKRILQLIGDTEAERLIMLGDVKHNVPRISISEKENIPDFFKDLCKEVEVEAIKGNHDGGIEKLTEGSCVKVKETDGMRRDKFYFNHGQSWPGEELTGAKILIRGHSHPAVKFKDDLGFSSTVPCWIRGPINKEKMGKKYGEEADTVEIITVPTFNQLITGMPINKEEGHRLLGPVLENGLMNMEESRVYLLDGTFIGKLEDL